MLPGNADRVLALIASVAPPRSIAGSTIYLTLVKTSLTIQCDAPTKCSNDWYGRAYDYVGRGWPSGNVGFCSSEPQRLKRVSLLHLPTTLAELAGVAGLRWTVETCSKRPKTNSVSIIARRVPGMLGIVT